MLNGSASVVPIKLAPSTVPELPVRVQPVELPGICQVAKPEASDVSILPTDGVPPVIFNPPATNIALLPVPAKTWVIALLPNCIVLLALTIAPLPIAVALVRFAEATSAEKPRAVLFVPEILEVSAISPSAVLLLPVVLYKSALTPLAVLPKPVVLD